MKRPVMTDTEHTLFEQGPDYWGSAHTRAERGAAMLDRWMPGWADRVSLPDFDISMGCSCVLGQIFGPELKEQEGVEASTPIVLVTGDPSLYRLSEAEGMEYSYGLKRLGLQSEMELWDPDAFYGFDGTSHDQVTYDELQQAWEPLIEVRKTPVSA